MCILQSMNSKCSLKFAEGSYVTTCLLATSRPKLWAQAALKRPELNFYMFARFDDYIAS